MTAKPATAAVLIIGNEILSGRTKDKNLGTIADALAARGIDLMEARCVPDIEDEIVAAVQALAARYSYVFSTGGIGPTHDDITADAMARAFNTGISHHPEAVRLLMDFFRSIGREPNEARLRMARIPEGASLIANPVSVAPGFRIENVFVMAGVPRIMQAMLEQIVPTLQGGVPVFTDGIVLEGGEGDVATALAEIQRSYPAVSIGSYPFEQPAGFATHLVARSRDGAALNQAMADVKALAQSLSDAGKVRGWRPAEKS
jgi:molybdenum cofactor synthesis domain-containing protein